MRKKKLLKDKNRNKKYKALRSKGSGITEYTDKNGNVIWLNLSKRLMFGGYKNSEYNKGINEGSKKTFRTIRRSEQ